MNKQEAIDILTGLYRIPVEKGADKFASEINKAIDMAIAALQDDWIPVSERLPEKAKQVMCCDKQGRVFTSAMTHINGNGEPSFGKHYGVTAWQPLPEPYKEGDTE